MDYRTTKAFDCFLSGLGAEGRDEALAALAREVDRIRAFPGGPGRARWIHQRVDEALARFAAQRPDVVAQVRCGKGCAHCCRLWVGVTREEAHLLAGLIGAGEARAAPGRMDVQRGWQAPAAFIGKPRAEAACVFLGEDGACTVYEERPSICRAVLVASDPEQCRLGDLSTRITAVINPYVEVIVSAALTVDAEEDPPPACGRHLATEVARFLEGRP
jgi:Fe-S-cluster containining protein